MKFFAVACLLSATSAVAIKEPNWIATAIKDPNWGASANDLQKCPDFDVRMTLTDGRTKAVPYP